MFDEDRYEMNALHQIKDTISFNFDGADKPLINQFFIENVSDI